MALRLVDRRERYDGKLIDMCDHAVTARIDSVHERPVLLVVGEEQTDVVVVEQPHVCPHYPSGVKESHLAATV